MTPDRPSDRQIRRSLRDLFRRAPKTPEEHRRRLEDELLAKHRRLYVHRPRRNLLLRPALLGGMLVALAIGAAALPVRHTVATGTLVVLELPTGQEDVPDVGELLAIARRLGGSREVSASLSRGTDDSVQIVVIFLGSADEPLDYGRRLQELDPRLEEATVRSKEVEAFVRVALAGILGHQLFGLEIDGVDPASARRSLLQGLTTGGIEGAEVQIYSGAEGRRIEIVLPD